MPPPLGSGGAAPLRIDMQSHLVALLERDVEFELRQYAISTDQDLGLVRFPGEKKACDNTLELVFKGNRRRRRHLEGFGASVDSHLCSDTKVGRGATHNIA